MVPAVIDLIRKRHPSPSWVVVEEVGNATGSAHSRYADAVAIGIWPSHGYAIHGFECKQSREDLKKELIDPTKADAIGKYCDYWWLVLSDKKLMDGFAIPEAWGVLYKSGQVLKVGKKAPKRDASPISRGFLAAAIRRVTGGWIPKREHEEYKANARELARKEIEQERKYKRDDVEFQFEELKRAVQTFERLSGIKLTRDSAVEGAAWPIGDWQIRDLAPAVEIVVKARDITHRKDAHDKLERLVEMELEHMDRRIENATWAMTAYKGAKFQLEALRQEARARDCQAGLIPTPDGDTSPAPSHGHDHEGGGTDRGHPGAPEQDAGLQLRDQRTEVSPGQPAPQDTGIDL